MKVDEKPITEMRCDESKESTTTSHHVVIVQKAHPWERLRCKLYQQFARCWGLLSVMVALREPSD
jgi:hypothetical protein